MVEAIEHISRVMSVQSIAEVAVDAIHEEIGALGVDLPRPVPFGPRARM